jgi:DNA polymerase-3 subunit gamma/tau
MSSNYQPLHHKYRPQRFDQLVGQEAITATLGKALTSNRIAPAYLFSGPRGTGKNVQCANFGALLELSKQ